MNKTKARLHQWSTFTTMVKIWIASYRLRQTIAVFLVACLCIPVHANEVSAQLKVYGKLTGNDDQILDLAYLKSLEQTSFTTKTPWTQGERMFTGVRLSTLLDSIGAQSNSFEAIAINNYRFTLTELDFEKYPIIVAYEIDGEPLTVKTLGPLWIMFPFDDYPELLTQKNKAACVWQLIELKVL